MEHKTAIIVGAGISGLVTLKTLLQKNIDCVLYEAAEFAGGLWHYSLHNYGVMECTHINVSKYNYAFSDFPFPDDVPDYPHHSQMAEYIERYIEHFQLYNHIEYRTRVISSRCSVGENGDKKWTLLCNSKGRGAEFSVSCDYLIVATGHHAKPKNTVFPGQDNFTGTLIHSVDFKDVITNNMAGKNVVIVGIGNSAVDATVNCVARGGCKNVYISTRSGAWIIPNYVFGLPTDLYASRFFLNSLPLVVQQFILESVVCLLSGHPRRWKLNPKMGALQTQPTVSPTLIHHIQRGNIHVVPNIRELMERSVRFYDGSIAHDVDAVVLCTGYTISLPYLPEDIVSKVLDKETNHLKLYKHVFSPDVGPNLAFVGFVQPASGGVLSMSEVQAQWLAMIIKDRCQLPSAADMIEDMDKSKRASEARYYKSTRHTIQEDPIIYNDTIASFFGGKPDIRKHPTLAHRLLLGSGGVAQWTLQGPFANEKAAELVKKVPLPTFSVGMVGATAFLLLWAIYWLLCLLVCRG